MKDKYYEQAVTCVKDTVLPAQIKLYQSCGGDFDKIYGEAMNGNGYFGKVIEAGHIYDLGYEKCTCPKVQSGQITDPDQCNCSRQSILYILSCLEPDSKFEVEILETILRGAEHCRFQITKYERARFRYGLDDKTVFDEEKEMEAVFGDNSCIDSWMQLVRKVSRSFPGLETEESLEEHKQTVLKFMRKKQALCVMNKETVAGVLLFSRSRNMICCLAVDPAHRKQGLASILLKKALDELDRSKRIIVSTFRENDDKGIAPRALYRKFGFQEGEMTEEFGYPNQIFVLYP